jgi:non-specific serine/threonine protein kinase
MSDDFKDCVGKLLQHDTTNRLGTLGGAEEIKSHPFFKSINWGLLRWEVPPNIPKLKPTRSAPPPAKEEPEEMFEIEV